MGFPPFFWNSPRMGRIRRAGRRTIRRSGQVQGFRTAVSASEVYAPADDDSSFSEVYRFHYAKLLRYCQYRLRDRHEAEDVAQEAFARAWRSMPTSAFDRNFYPWLKVVASNLCTDVLRKRNRSEPVAVIDLGSIA